jgi:hypothetical protein
MQLLTGFPVQRALEPACQQCPQVEPVPRALSGGSPVAQSCSVPESILEMQASGAVITPWTVQWSLHTNDAWVKFHSYLACKACSESCVGCQSNSSNHSCIIIDGASQPAQSHGPSARC